MRKRTSVTDTNGLVTAFAGSVQIASVRFDVSAGNGAMTFGHDPGSNKLYIYSRNIENTGLDEGGYRIITPTS